MMDDCDKFFADSDKSVRMLCRTFALENKQEKSGFSRIGYWLVEKA